MRGQRQLEPPDLITIAEAAKLLGLNLPTMRRWDESGKFPAPRHPINSYRIYTRDEGIELRKKEDRREGEGSVVVISGDASE